MTVKELIGKLKEFDESKDVRLVVENVDLLEARELADIEIELAENNLVEIQGEW